MTKYVNELYAEVFARAYGVEAVGLRYFNVFGARQDPEGAYAAVIPRWARALARGDRVAIYGDGETSRDFCHVANAVQANLRAAIATDPAALNQVYNVAVGERTTLNELHHVLAEVLRERLPGLRFAPPVHEPFRFGDVRHSQADIGKAGGCSGTFPRMICGRACARRCRGTSSASGPRRASRRRRCAVRLDREPWVPAAVIAVILFAAAAA